MIGTEYATSEIIWWLLVAALAGFVIGWLLRRWFLDRQEYEPSTELAAEHGNELAALQAEVDDWKGKVAGVSTDLDQRTADLERMRTQLDEREKKIADLDGKISGHRTEVSKLESKVEDREATIASLRSNMSKEDGQVTGLRKEIDAANGTIGTLRKDADGYKATIDALRTDLDSGRRKQAKLEEDLAAARSEAESAATSLANARSAADELRSRIAELEAGVSGSGDLEARITSLEAELKQARQDRDAAAEKLANLESEHADCEGKLATALSASDGDAVSQPAAELPDKDVAVAKVAEIATRTRGSGPVVDDDLKKIHGVGPKLEQLLKSMDITSFRQVANFTNEDIQYVTAALDAFPGRIERDNWMSSAADEHTKKYGEPA